RRGAGQAGGPAHPYLLRRGRHVGDAGGDIARAAAEGTPAAAARAMSPPASPTCRPRSEEHTSELQSRFEIVCRLLLEKKKQTKPARSETRPRRARTALIGVPPARRRRHHSSASCLPVRSSAGDHCSYETIPGSRGGLR